MLLTLLEGLLHLKVLPSHLSQVAFGLVTNRISQLEALLQLMPLYCEAVVLFSQATAANRCLRVLTSQSIEPTLHFIQFVPVVFDSLVAVLLDLIDPHYVSFIRLSFLVKLLVHFMCFLALALVLVLQLL